MRPTPAHLVLILFAAVFAAGATCSKAVEPDGEGAADPAVDAAVDAGPVAPPRAGEPDFGPLTQSARRELDVVLSDEFCYCGCPHALGTCLREHPGCRHAPRMARLAAHHTRAGFPGTDVIGVLAAYYQGFRQPRAQLPVDARFCQGSPGAKVTVVEYFDYECPFCASAAAVLDAFAKKYAAKVRVCAVPFPLPSHPNSGPATTAALFARDAGKFWQMHALLLENQMGLSPAFIKGLGTQVGLSPEALGKALGTSPYAAEIEKMKEVARAAGVDGTPTLFVNGRKFELDLTEEVLVHVVDDELEWSSNGGAWTAD